MIEFTCLTSADCPPKRMTKVYEDDKLNPRSYDRSFLFSFNAMNIESIEELYEVLIMMEEMPMSGIIRGKPAEDVNDGDVIRRLAFDNEEAKATMIDNPINWVCLDIDSDIDIPPSIDQEDIAEYVLHEQFPPEFHLCDYIFQFSSSAGLKGWGRGHFFFLMDGYYTSKQMKGWSETHTFCDSSLFNPVQIHYTAVPLFTGLVEDPVKRRTFLKIKDNRSVEITFLFNNKEVEGDCSWSSGIAQESDAKYNKWRVQIAKVSSHSAHPYLISAMGSYHFRYGEFADWDYFASVYINQLVEVGHPRADVNMVSQEIDQALLTVKRQTSLNKKMNTDCNYILTKLKVKKNEYQRTS